MQAADKGALYQTVALTSARITGELSHCPAYKGIKYSRQDLEMANRKRDLKMSAHSKVYTFDLHSNF